MSDQVPRRNRLDLMTPAELAIFAATQVVEAVGADPRLTDAVVALSEARASLADFVDNVPRREPPVIPDGVVQLTEELRAYQVPTGRDLTMAEHLAHMEHHARLAAFHSATSPQAAGSAGLEQQQQARQQTASTFGVAVRAIRRWIADPPKPKKAQLTLEQLEAALMKFPLCRAGDTQTIPLFVEFEVGGLVPTTFNSWRWKTNEIALGFEDRGRSTDGRCSLEDFLTRVRDAQWKDFTAWKGGEYTMRPETPVWIDNAGCSTFTALVGVKRMDDAIVLQTRRQEVEF